MNYLDSLDAGDWISSGAVLVAMAAAGISAWQARIARASADGQLALSERVHREANEPYVIVDIQPDAPGSSLLVLLIENIGPTVARDVTIAVDPPLVSASGDHLTERLQNGLSRTIPMLPPGRRLKYAFDIAFRRFDSDLPTAYTFTVQTKGPFGDVEPMEYLVDISSWRETLLGEHPNAKVEKALNDVARSLNSLAAAQRRQNGADDSTP